MEYKKIALFSLIFFVGDPVLRAYDLAAPVVAATTSSSMVEQKPAETATASSAKNTKGKHKATSLKRAKKRKGGLFSSFVRCILNGIGIVAVLSVLTVFAVFVLEFGLIVTMAAFGVPPFI